MGVLSEHIPIIQYALDRHQQRRERLGLRLAAEHGYLVSAQYLVERKTKYADAGNGEYTIHSR